MLKHYLKITLRTFYKSKVYTLINMIGLTTGMVVFFLIMLYVNYEFSVDGYHEHKNRIFRIVKQEVGNMYLGNDRFAVTMAPLGPAVEEEFPEVEAFTRIVRRWNILNRVGNETVLEPVVYGIDPAAFEMFTFESVLGNPDTYLKDKYSAVITESIATKYYKDENPIGKTFLFKDQHEITVVGVVRDMPANSHFRMDIMLPFESFLELNDGIRKLQDWESSSYYTYLLLHEGSEANDLEAKLPAMWKKYTSNQQEHGESTTKLYLQAFSKIHLHSDVHFDIAATTDIKRLYIYSTIAFLILLIACINYMNLATARAALRAKEVGVRKVAGAFRFDLIAQFLGESLLVTFCSLVLSLLLIALILPYFENFVELDLSLNLLDNPGLLFKLLMICGFVGIVSGSYPAFNLSSYKPIAVLKGSFYKSTRKSGLRNGLVITQFAISGSLIICALIISQQLLFIEKKDMGYNRDHIVTMRINDGDLVNKMSVFKDELRNVPGVLNVSSSSNLPNNISNSTDIKWPGKPEEISWTIYEGRVDADFVEVYNLELVAGKNISEELGDDGKAVLINESAARLLDWEDPIGRELITWRDTGTIVGVLKDFHQHSLHQEIMPLQLFSNEDEFQVSIKISGDNIDKTLAGIEKVKSSFSDKFPFTYAFFDDVFDKAYKSEMKTGKLARWFTLITIIIACLGLYGLAAFTAEQRIKEVGIRKVLGAKVYPLIFMLSKDFTLLVIISFVISAPIAYYFMLQWLNDFAYHINIGVTTFLGTLIIMILVSWFTVAYRTFKVANSNPVNSLRNE